MTKAKPHTTFFRNSILLLMLLFTLAPCSVKESGMRIFNIEYQRSLNKTKVTTNKNTCENVVQTAFKTVKVQKLLKQKDVTTYSYNFLIDTSCLFDDSLAYSSKKPSELTQHLYILYKRLKLDIA